MYDRITLCIGCIGLVVSTGALAILLSLCIVIFSTVMIIVLLKWRKRAKALPPVTSERVTSRSQSPVYEMMSVVHPSAIGTKQNIASAYSGALKH